MMQMPARRTADSTALIGSEKQVAWAESIRTAKLQQLDQSLAVSAAQMQDQGVPAETIAERMDSIAPFVAQVRSELSAKWWIDHRSEFAVDIVRAMYKAATR